MLDPSRTSTPAGGNTGSGPGVRAELRERGPPHLTCLPRKLTLNLKSSWLVEPFMVNDWEKLRKKQREVRTRSAYSPVLWDLDLGPKEPPTQAPPWPWGSPHP